MTQKDFAKKYINKTQGFWSLVLSGERKLDYDNAEVVGRLFGTSARLWAVNKSGDEKAVKAWIAKRVKAWKQFQRRMK